MIREWLTHRLTPAPEAVKELGYLKEAIAIEARYRRCRRAWKEHLERTRRFVLWSAANCPRQDKVTILGSGGLLDVPLDDLAEDFQEVVLVDIVQTPKIRRWAAQYDNVTLVEGDVTSLLEAMAADGSPPLDPPTPYIPEGDADLVVSLNLLGQLPLIPARHLAKDTAKDKAAAFAEAVQRQHLRALQALPGRICLITETLREWVADGEVEETEPAIGEIKLPEPEQAWTWDLAPAPELEPDRSLRLRIAAYGNLFRK